MKSIVIILIIFGVVDLFAQDTMQINLNESIKLALENNHDLKLAKFEKDKAEEKVNEAWGSAVLPNITGSVHYSRALKQSQFYLETPFFSGSFPSGTQNTMTIGANLQQPLFTGAVFLAVRIARTYAEINEQMYTATKAEMVVNVKRAYYSVLLSGEVLKLTKESLQLAEDNLSNTEKMYKVGAVPEYDFVRAKVQVQNLIPEVQQSKNSYEVAKNLLRLVTGIPRGKEVKIKDSLNLREINASGFEDAVNIMVEKNGAIKQLELQNEMQKDAVSYEFSKHFPELYFTSNWQTQAQENDGRAFSDWRYKNSVYIGLNLKVPIFNGFQTSSKVEQAQIDQHKSEEQYTKILDVMKNQLEEVLLNINQTREKLDAYNATIKEAQLGYDIASKRYKTGLGTQLEVVDAMVSLTRSQVNYYSSVYDYYIYHAMLDQLLNKQPESLIN